MATMLVSLFYCTENPFSQQSEITNNIIRGTVALDDGESPENVHVWFEPYDLGTRTDEKGCFSLLLPASGNQPGSRLSGIFDLYFYTANYLLKIVKIPIYNGVVQYSQETFNPNGELIDLVILEKILSLRASINPRIFYKDIQDNQDTVDVSITLQAVEDSVTVTGSFSKPKFKGDPQFMTGFIKSKHKADPIIRRIIRKDRAYRTVDFSVGTDTLQLIPVGVLDEVSVLPPGEYEIVPYLRIHQENIPPGLMESMGTDVFDFGPEFLKIPLKIDNNHFRIF